MCNTVVRANFCGERALPPHTGSFEISCRLPVGKVLFLAPTQRVPKVQGPLGELPPAGRGSPVRHGEERGRQSRPTAGSSPRNLGRSRIANRAGGRHLRPSREAAARAPAPAPAPGCLSVARAGPAGLESLRGSPAWGRAAGPGPELGKLGGPPGPPPAPPLTEEALHDPQRVAEPILPTGHLADGPGPARPGVPRRGSSSGARSLVARALPRTASFGARAARPPGASGNRGCGGDSPEAAGHGQAARAGPQPPLRTMAGNRRRRPRCLRPGWSSRGEGRRERAARPRGREEGRVGWRGGGARRGGAATRRQSRRHLGDGQKEGHSGLWGDWRRGRG